jgi:predicted phosphodiesterase
MRGKAIVDALELDIHAANINKFLARQGIGATGEIAELTLAESRREQMEQLFSGYTKTPPILIDKMKEGARVVVASDFQIPFEERWLIGGTQNKTGAFEAFLKDYDPDLVILNGDIRDAYALSTFDKSPSRRFGEKEEKRLTQNALRTIKANAPRARLIFVNGNHEERLEKTYAQLCQKDTRAFEIFDAQGFNELNTRSMLDLPGLGWEWQPYRGWVNVLGFIVTHGDLVASESAQTAAKMQKKWHSSGTSGHTHRLGAYFHTDSTGKAHAWYESGCMCRLDLEYVTNPDWQQGFLIGQVSDNTLHTQLVPVFNNKFIVPGTGVYKAKV